MLQDISGYDVFSLYFETQWQSKNNLKTFFFRLVTQIFTKSKYEHIANAIKCPKECDGLVYGGIKVEAGKYYVFEATKAHGFIITEFYARLQNPSLDDKQWSGCIDIQLPFMQYNSTLYNTWQDAVCMLGTPYSLTSAIVSSLDQFHFFQKFKKIFAFNKKLTNGIFCSMFALINLGKYFDIKITKEQARLYTPEEVLHYLLLNKLASLPFTAIKYVDGKIMAQNIDIPNSANL